VTSINESLSLYVPNRTQTPRLLPISNQ